MQWKRQQLCAYTRFPSPARVGSGWAEIVTLRVGPGVSGLTATSCHKPLLSLWPCCTNTIFHVYRDVKKTAAKVSLLRGHLGWATRFVQTVVFPAQVPSLLGGVSDLFRSRVGGSVVLISFHLFSLRTFGGGNPVSSLFLLPGDLGASPLPAQPYWNRFLPAPLPCLLCLSSSSLLPCDVHIYNLIVPNRS